MLAIPFVAGFDERFDWSPEVASAVHVAGLAGVAVGQALFSWAMATNRYFSTAVRIQEERSHTVVTGGPYRYVRHPGYTGYMLTFFAMPLVCTAKHSFETSSKPTY